jgi:lambda family phage portal protein
MSEILKLKQAALAASAPSEQMSFFGSDVAPFRGAGFEGAERRHRETVDWRPAMTSPDQQINIVKPLADARSRDMVQNDGYASGAVQIHRDSIVGAEYRLNAKPDHVAIGKIMGTKADLAGWAEEFQLTVESLFGLIASSESCWLDASRRNTFTDIIRLAIGTYVPAGEVLATSEWLSKKSDGQRPLKTAIQLLSPDRLSNPNNTPDMPNLRRGVRLDDRGRPLAYTIRGAYPTEVIDPNSYRWDEIAAEKPWGRKQVIHIVEQMRISQTRGISDMVSVLKQMRMTKQFQEITLQNAVINASYAAAIESELPRDAVYQLMGGPGTTPVLPGQGNEAWLGQIGAYMAALNQYMEASGNIKLDSAKIPHLFPGTKLNLTPMGTPGGVGSDFEVSLLRHIAAALGLSYEEFSRDYTKTNYSSARASMANTWRFMQSRKKVVADRLANNIYQLCLEEMIAEKMLPLPPGMTRDYFYLPLMKEAFSVADWIGASQGQIDEMKETQAALLRVKGGLSTYERESARLGTDFRKNFEQLAREQKLIEKYDLNLNTDVSSRTLQSGTGGPADDNQNNASTTNSDSTTNKGNN